LFSDVCPVPSTLKVERNPTTGELLGYNEVFLLAILELRRELGRVSSLN